MAFTFSPPARLRDFDAIVDQRAAWHTAMAAYTRAAVARAEGFVGGGRAQYYDPSSRAVVGAVAERVITWNGFPKQLYEGRTEREAWEAAEQLIDVPRPGRTVVARPQDEYLEWFTHRDAAGRVVAVDFTCEGPEYWEALAHGYPAQLTREPGWPPASGDVDAVLALYRRHVAAGISRSALLRNRRYDPYNRWNTGRGAMHLTHPSNTLSAEIFLAGDATVLRQRGGVLLDDDDDLIRCAGYGEPGRASDPTIGGAVNTLARAGALITLKNPVGLYIAGLDTTGWTKPDGRPVGDYWRITRGSRGAIVRARYEVPRREGFVVGQVQIGGEPIEYGGQIAERITMKLTGLAAEQGRHRASPVGCRRRAPAPASEPGLAGAEIGLRRPHG